MDAKLQALLDEAKKQKNEERRNHLIALGLTDDQKTIRKESKQPYELRNASWDKEKNVYYAYEIEPIDITDEEYSELCKYHSPLKEEDSTAEKTLSTIAAVVLWVGIIVSGFLLISAFAAFAGGNSDGGFLRFYLIIPVMLYSLTAWAVMRVVCNISNNTRNINSKLK